MTTGRINQVSLHIHGKKNTFYLFLLKSPITITFVFPYPASVERWRLVEFKVYEIEDFNRRVWWRNKVALIHLPPSPSKSKKINESNFHDYNSNNEEKRIIAVLYFICHVIMRDSSNATIKHNYWQKTNFKSRDCCL